MPLDVVNISKISFEIICSYKSTMRQVLPPTVTLCEGNYLILSVATDIWPTPCIQWQFNNGDKWKDLRNQTSSYLKLLVLQQYDGYKYRAIVCSKCDRYTTNITTLNVNYNSIIQQPVSQPINPLFLPTEVSFTAIAESNPPATIQWQVNQSGSWVDIPNANSTTLTVTITSNDLNNRYRAIFTSLLYEGFSASDCSQQITREVGLILPRIAIYGVVSTPNYNLDVKNKLYGTGLFSQVDILAASPLLSVLLEYDGVIVHTDSILPNSVTLGDILADYVDLNHGLVLGGYTFSTLNPGIKGRLVTDDYLPYVQNSSVDVNLNNTLVPVIPMSLLLQDVNTFSGGANSIKLQVSMNSGATLIANWSNGFPLIGYKANVVGLNFQLPSNTVNPTYWVSTTDGARIMSNAILYTIGQ